VGGQLSLHGGVEQVPGAADPPDDAERSDAEIEQLAAHSAMTVST
jgi:hypothetical protein